MASRTGDAGVRNRIIEAALETIRAEGFAGTSVRAIARRGRFNSALIFYYFGSLNALLLAALDHSSAQRLERYRAAVDGAASIEELAEVAGDIYREDLEGGHITVFSEMVAASLSHRELGPELVARAEPWLHLVEEAVTKVLDGSPLLQLLPARQIAYAVLSFYLGVNLLAHLDEDRSRIDALFESVEHLAPLAASLLPEGAHRRT